MEEPQSPKQQSPRDGHELVVPRAAPPVARHFAPASHAPSDNGINPRKLFDAIRYWWKWALPAGILLACGAAATVYSTFTPQFQASAWLRIEEHTPYLAFESEEAGSQSKGFVQTQIELLRSPMVLRPVAAQQDVTRIADLAGEPNLAEALRRRIEIKAVGGSELHTLSFSCSHPQSAARVVNAVLDSYFRLRASEQGQRMERVIKILDQERDARAQEVETLRKSVRDLAKEVTGRDPFQTVPEDEPDEKKGLSEQADRLISIEVEECVLKARLQVLEGLPNQPSSGVPDAEVDYAVSNNPAVKQAEESLALKQQQLSKIASKLVRTNDSPAYQRAERDVKAAEKALEELTVALRNQTKEHLHSQQAGRVAEEIASLKAELDNKRIMRELLQDRYKEDLKELKQSTGDTITLKFRHEELARAEKVLDLISDRIVTLKTEQGAPPRVWEMQRAETPTGPIKPVPYLNMALASLFALCLPFGLAVFKEQMTARISSAEFVERQAQLPMLGEITHLPSRSSTTGVLGRRDQLALGMFEESVDMLRSTLYVRARGKRLRVVAITSSVKQEGKTSVSAQLAISIARATGERVLIVDGDMRSPSLHRVFDVAAEPGLVEVLSGICQIPSAITGTSSDRVDVLPAGILRTNPHALLENGRWEEFLKQLPGKYRHVVVDTPPVLAAGESLVLTRGADSVLLCALRDVTRVPQLRRATERIAAAGVRVTGLVLNGVPGSHYVDRYGSYPYSRV